MGMAWAMSLAFRHVSGSFHLPLETNQTCPPSNPTSVFGIALMDCRAKIMLLAISCGDSVEVSASNSIACRTVS